MPIARYVVEASRGGDEGPSPDLSASPKSLSPTKVTPASEPFPLPTEARPGHREVLQPSQRPVERLNSGGEQEWEGDHGLQNHTHLTEQETRQRARTQGRRLELQPQSHRYAAMEPERNSPRAQSPRRERGRVSMVLSVEHVSQSPTQEQPRSSGSGLQADGWVVDEMVDLEQEAEGVQRQIRRRRSPRLNSTSLPGANEEAGPVVGRGGAVARMAGEEGSHDTPRSPGSSRRRQDGARHWGSHQGSNPVAADKAVATPRRGTVVNDEEEEKKEWGPTSVHEPSGRRVYVQRQRRDQV